MYGFNSDSALNCLKITLKWPSQDTLYKKKVSPMLKIDDLNCIESSQEHAFPKKTISIVSFAKCCCVCYKKAPQSLFW